MSGSVLPEMIFTILICIVIFLFILSFVPDLTWKVRLMNLGALLLGMTSFVVVLQLRKSISDPDSAFWILVLTSPLAYAFGWIIVGVATVIIVMISHIYRHVKLLINNKDVKFLFCMIGYHLWGSSCICKRCGNRRDEGHNFRPCTCSLCGMVKHNWVVITEERHRNGTEYERQGSFHDAEGGHDTWTEVKITQKCTKCGKVETNTYIENYEKHSY